MRLRVSPKPAGAYPFDVVGLGLNSVDLVTAIAGPLRPDGKHPADTMLRVAGGQTATAMATCAKLGWRARYVGHFGGDENGRFSESSLAAAGVDVSTCRSLPGTKNQFAIIVVDRHSGQRTIMWQRDPSLRMRAADVEAESVTAGRVLLVDCAETEAAIEAARLARRAGIPSVIDVERVRPKIETLLGEVDVIIAAQAFPSAFTGVADLGRAMHELASRFDAALTGVTLGADGSLAIVDGQEIRSPGRPIDVVDSTGAGDAFRGGFIAGWLASGKQAEAGDLLAYANAVGALNCRGLGARGGLPTAREVDALLGGAPQRP
ncbi:MAG: carbohydrate kinase family protein [Vicinamibacterales bacterium]|nr:carbohydrate kinase family protein [Vicinamibacterales bacterium]MDP7472631.1 carbohydrate kinase family protein [Vicinamibacterales bacterium]MDP7671994.1 carbohydrate kinase family protein [Vicinamibacterales bacterium]HJO37210.1 carbohydrate kinase family protein [Vicinamibacterales bacterium]